MEFKFWIEKLRSGEVDVRRFVGGVRDTDRYQELLLEELKVQTDADDAGLLSKLVEAVAFMPSPIFTIQLCLLLDSRRSPSYLTSIVDALHIIRDERSVPSLTAILEHRIENDPEFSVNRKALFALFRIGTPDAIDAIERASESEHGAIREVAQRLVEIKIAVDRSGADKRVRLLPRFNATNVRDADELKYRSLDEVLEWLSLVSSGAVTPDSDFHWLGLAATATSRMQNASDWEYMKSWARVAVQIYELLAKDDPKFQLSAMRARSYAIIKHGSKVGDDLLDTNTIIDWFFSTVHFQPEEAKIKSDQFWPRVREQGIRKEDMETIREVRYVKNKLAIFKELIDVGVKINDERIDEWLNVFPSLL